MQVFEILDEISSLKSDDLKIKTLKERYYDHTPLHRVLKMNFCKTIVPMLPDGIPPFNRNDVADGPNRSSLWEYLRIFPVIVRSGQSVKMRPLQIEKMFIEMLEAVDPLEADIICIAKDKALNDKFDINVDVVKTAFPALNIENNSIVTPPSPKTSEERAAEFLERAEVKKAEAKKLNQEAKNLIAKAKELANEDA